MIGRTLSHYRILEKLGAGGMGEVYRARDEKLGRDVAVKVLPPGLLSNEEARARFRKEALALSRLSHPHIATLLDFDSQDGTDFLVMELVEGKTLLEAVREGPLSEKEVVRLGSQLARGLQAAHEHGVIHRDLKPGNLALTPDGLLKVLDFGLARLERLTLPEVGEKTASTDTAVGHVVGTPAYMAPEQLRGKGVDARTDVYGAGACLYELATGRRPFGTKSGVELTDAVLHEAPVAPRSVERDGVAGPGGGDPEVPGQGPGASLPDGEGAAGRPGAAAGGARRPVRRARSSAAFPAPSPLAPRGVRRGDRRGGSHVVPLAVAAPRVTGVRPLTGELTLGTGSTPLPAGRPRTASGSTTWPGGGSHRPLATAGKRRRPRRSPPALRFNDRTILGYVPGESALLMLGATEAVSDDAPDYGVPLWLVPVPTGTPRRVPNLRARWGDLSPDGHTLVLVRGQSARNHRLYLAQIDGSGERPLITVPLGVGVTRWAPDGRRLRFTSAGPPGHEREQWIWETSIAGEIPRPLWRGHSGAWTQDGRYFIYGGPGGSLLALPESPHPWERRAEPRPLTVGPLAYTFAQSDPRGRWLLAIGSMFGGELLRYRAETRRWEPALNGESVIGVEASPDRGWLAWVRLPDASLWRSRPDGSERLRLTGPGIEAFHPRWSTDGRRIVFAGRTTDDLQDTIRVVAVDGSSAQVVARPEDPKADYWDPC